MLADFLPLLVWLAAACGLALLLKLLFRLFYAPPPPPYLRREDFLTPAELAFFRVLEEAVAERWYIFPKVRIGDLLCVAEGTENARGWFARIGQKHVDFILADRETVQPVLVIELDDSSHDAPHRQERDRFVDAALEAAGLPIYRQKAMREYCVPEVAQAIAARVPA